LSEVVVSDSSTLIALQQVGFIECLREVFGEVLIPEAVSTEIAGSVPALDWLKVRRSAQPIGAEILHVALHPGESEAISLAIELRSDWLILDDLRARRNAEALGLPVVGTLGLLLVFKRRELIPSVREVMNSLMSFNFGISDALYNAAIAAAGE
jgi:predicted nucleic acid-binding protein